MSLQMTNKISLQHINIIKEQIIETLHWAACQDRASWWLEFSIALNLVSDFFFILMAK